MNKLNNETILELARIALIAVFFVCGTGLICDLIEHPQILLTLR